MAGYRKNNFLISWNLNYIDNHNRLRIYEHLLQMEWQPSKYCSFLFKKRYSRLFNVWKVINLLDFGFVKQEWIFKRSFDFQINK